MMLFLVMRLGEDRYVLNTGQVSDVLPFVQLTPVPHAPPGVAGGFNFRGSPMIVLDLAQLVLGRPSQVKLSTRLVVVTCKDSAGTPCRLGVIAEHATDTIRLNPMSFEPRPISSEVAAYLGPVATDPRGLIHWIDPARLLPASVGDAPAEIVAPS